LFALGTKNYFGPVPPLGYNSGDIPLSCGTSRKEPLVIVETPIDLLPINIKEYGYGYWFRYLTHFPERQWGGKANNFYSLSGLYNGK